jgi:hypothetical protein
MLFFTWRSCDGSEVEEGMIVGPLSPHVETISRILHDTDGNVRGAMICWAVVVSALIILRVPRQVVLACLLVASATVGLAALVIEAAPVDAVASAPEPQSRPTPIIHRIGPAAVQRPGSTIDMTTSLRAPRSPAQ